MTEHTRRQLRDVTAHALHRLIMSSDEVTSEETREAARAALAQLDGGTSEPGAPDPSADIFRQRVQPGLWVALDASHCIVLELRTPDDAELIGRTALSNCDQLSATTDLARVKRAEAEEAADDARRDRLSEKLDEVALRELLGDGQRPGEDTDSLVAAMDALVRAGVPSRGIRYLIRRAYGHTGATFNVEGTEELGTVTYGRATGEYYVRVPAVPPC